MLNKSIAYRLSIYVSIAVIGVFLTFIIIAYHFNSGLIKSNIENKAITLGYQAMMLGEKQLVSTREITSNIAEQVIYFAKNDDVDFLVSQLLSKYHYLNAIHVNINIDIPNLKFRNSSYFKTPDSLYYRKSNESFFMCDVEKSIFEAVRQNGAPAWTETFYCHRNGKHVVAYFAPITIKTGNNQAINAGSVITELSLFDLNDTINSMKIGKTGYAFLVSTDGTYLTHPNQDLILKKNLFSLNAKEFKGTSEQIKNILKKGLTGSVIAYPEYLNYTKCWIHYTQIKETSWFLLFVVPYDELFMELYLLILRMLFFSVLGILIIFFIVTYITNKLIKPLSTVTSQLKAFSRAAGESGLTTRNEIELVSSSLDYLKSWYQKYEMKQQYDQKLNSQREKDLLEASEIQMSLINTDFSVFENKREIDFYAVYKPARIVSGDLFDFMFLDDDNLFFTIGDVSGKGVPAAFFMSVAQTILKSASRLKSPAKIVESANNDLQTINHHQFFLTLFCGVLNLKTRILKYCNAAHTATLIMNKRGEIIELGNSHGMPLGLYPNKEYQEQEIKLRVGDLILLYSDGVSELFDDKYNHYGIERLKQVLTNLTATTSKSVIEEIEKDLDEHKKNINQPDDITLVAIKFKNRKRN